MDAAETTDEGAVYNIGTAARKSGLSVTTIRTWEDRYGAVVPVRDVSGRRLYSPEQIAQLTWLRQQIDAGLRASEAHRLLISGVTDSRVGATVGDHGSGWATLLVWSDQERDWIMSILSDLRRGLQAETTALALAVDNAVCGPVLSLTLVEPQPGDGNELRDFALLVLRDSEGVEEQLEEGGAVTLPVSGTEVAIAPLDVAGSFAGALVAVEPQVDDPAQMLRRAVRVIESRIEADRARSAFSSLLD